jgi:hypothetical protein
MINTPIATPEEIRHAGLGALTRALGPVGMVRFLRQFTSGHGDYTADRQQWIDNVSLDEILAEIQRNKHRRG